jgi:hypothetical protein
MVSGTGILSSFAYWVADSSIKIEQELENKNLL